VKHNASWDEFVIDNGELEEYDAQSVLQAAVWSILKQIAVNRKLKNKSKRC